MDHRIDAVPRNLGSVRATRIRNTIVLLLIAAAATAGPAALLLTATANQRNPETAGEDPLHRGFASAAAAAWAAGDLHHPIVTADGVPSDLGRPASQTDGHPEPAGPFGESHIGWDRVDLEIVDGRALERHHFTVATPDRLYHLVVPVTETAMQHPDDRPVPALAARPYLESVVLRPTAVPPATFPPAFDPAPVPPQVHDRIIEWAHAWAADDARALYSVVGDSEHVVYRGLGGWTAVDVAVGPSVTVAYVDETPALNAVRVTVELASPSTTVTVDVDVLIARPTQPLPNVVAWGPAGTGTDLQPYSNAVPVGAFRSGLTADDATFRPGTSDDEEGTDEDR